MEIHELLAHLEDFPLSLIGKKDPSADIYSLHFYTSDSTAFESNILYFCPSSKMPPPEYPHTLQLLCYGRGLHESDYRNTPLNILYYDSDEPIEPLFNQVQAMVTHLQRANAGLHLFANAFFSDQGLQYMADIAYEVFGNPVFVVDSSFKYLAISSAFSPNNTILEEELASGYILESGIRSIREANLDEKVRSSNTPYYFQTPLHGTGMLIAPVKIHGIEVAKVMLYESLKPITDIDSLLLSRLARFISMELQKDSFYNQNRDVMFSYFLADLLDNPDTNYPSVRERLHILGFDLKEDLYIMTISASSYREANAKLEVIVRELNNILTGSLYAIYENTLVMLFSRTRENGLSAYELHTLETYLVNNSLTAGMSNFFTDLKTARRFYLQAQKAAEVGLRLQDPGPIHYYSDAYFYHIMEICEKEEDLQYFIHPAMMKLLYHDTERHSELLKTMYHFLQTPGNPGKTAENLHIHKNTLLYRMNKIKSLTGCSLEDGDEIMSLGLSYKLMRYLKMLPEESK
ncbi:MAG: PucR family transcriptional regulator [Lachnospiraceae bacterium]|nr:PucR family transcriptional regulator [Lachnospiraceae bacterium]